MGVKGEVVGRGRILRCRQQGDEAEPHPEGQRRDSMAVT
jgi:hypothetical protein